ncbi:LutC/YkgG family protein [Paraburkholderia guartelaensis]|uniref:LutC/YkgG family protein n=1 Tax=Paraburkholderia guartelaensis TaxID=2546446 RepID=UPI002AB63591|nr:lactate utilization protein C [Paraburkholderia guartelaensis]
MSARARMLERLRGHVPAAPSTTLEALDARIDAHFTERRALAPLALTDRIAQFRRMLEAAHAEVICASAATWAADLAERLAAAGVRNLLLDTACAEGQALEAALPPAVQARSYAQPIEQWKAELFDTVDAGFTVARSGLAATGTLVVVPDANAPRTVSLVPPLHVALIHADTLHADLHAAVAAERWRDGMPTNLVMISGPSKTSDIQQTTAYGAHGPRALWVVVVTDDDSETGAQHGAAE